MHDRPCSLETRRPPPRRILFPVPIMLLVPLRHWAMPRFFRHRRHLQELDAAQEEEVAPLSREQALQARGGRNARGSRAGRLGGLLPRRAADREECSASARSGLLPPAQQLAPPANRRRQRRRAWGRPSPQWAAPLAPQPSLEAQRSWMGRLQTWTASCIASGWCTTSGGALCKGGLAAAPWPEGKGVCRALKPAGWDHWRNTRGHKCAGGVPLYTPAGTPTVLPAAVFLPRCSRESLVRRRQSSGLEAAEAEAAAAAAHGEVQAAGRQRGEVLPGAAGSPRSRLRRQSHDPQV